jgi:hypothetical protein
MTLPRPLVSWVKAGPFPDPTVMAPCSFALHLLQRLILTHLRSGEENFVNTLLSASVIYRRFVRCAVMANLDL